MVNLKKKPRIGHLYRPGYHKRPWHVAEASGFELSQIYIYTTHTHIITVVIFKRQLDTSFEAKKRNCPNSNSRE